ncbi:sperm acrosome-associated protein 9 isoform X1 [Rhinatrema bivittatum]|uniref:sperm acrosome-associated protein 9 isoform X1 n=2 Tax=Rhinatrema bivittatum TaxID=194408 RepID=UPI00112EE939|nr:sperm acrosome-associated protein 9 isoform X1 [Rhinatrema bivittatum]
MCEAPQTLKNLEDRCKVFRQQQFIFIRALDNARENAHDKINPVKNISQVQHYLDNNCHNLTDKRILNMFLDTCSDLNKYCTRMETKHPETNKSGAPVSKCKTLLHPTSDLTSVRAKYPHDVVNRLSCDEAKNFYGGIVSVIPMALDFIKDGVAQIEKPRHDPL